MYNITIHQTKAIVLSAVVVANATAFAPAPAFTRSTGALCMASDTFDTMAVIINDKLGVDIPKIKPESKFSSDLGADSLDIVELVMAFEEKFGIDVDDDEAGKLKTVQDVIDYMETLPKKE